VRFKSEDQDGQMPEVNLVPMMDVIMTILTFFIIVSMTLSDFQSVSVPLPKTDNSSKERLPEPLTIAIDKLGKITLRNQPVNQDQLAQQVVNYLEKNPKGAVVLRADRQLTYDKVVQVFSAVQQVGGDRVSLAVEAN
jgi:biopolymer transport protein ExbD